MWGSHGLYAQGQDSAAIQVVCSAIACMDDQEASTSKDGVLWEAAPHISCRQVVLQVPWRCKFQLGKRIAIYMLRGFAAALSASQRWLTNRCCRRWPPEVGQQLQAVLTQPCLCLQELHQVRSDYLRSKEHSLQLEAGSRQLEVDLRQVRAKAQQDGLDAAKALRAAQESGDGLRAVRLGKAADLLHAGPQGSRGDSQGLRMQVRAGQRKMR